MIIAENQVSRGQLVGKVCLITGAAKGLGRATAEAFIREGAIVYATDRNLEELHSWSREYTSSNAGVLNVFQLDVVDRDASRQAIIRVTREQSQLDVLVNNAGIMRDALIGAVTPMLIAEVMNTNVIAQMELLQLAAKVMMRQHSGSIINLSSIVGMLGNPGQLAYSSSKGAVLSMTRTAAKELGPKGIRVNAIAPGMIDTDMLRGVSPEIIDRYVGLTALGRLGDPREIANVAVFLASEGSSFITGQTLVVDGCVSI